MLVVDVKERATLQEIMSHPWMTKGFNGPPENFVPSREPLQLPLDPAVINKMQGFDFGPANYIQEQLTKIIESEDYQHAMRRAVKDDSLHGGLPGDRKRGMFEFYKRRNSTSREGLTAPSTEAIRGSDPLNAYSPLVSVYMLAREKLERERVEANPGALSLGTPADAPPLKAPGLPSPEAAHTNTFSPELPGESATGGRARARSRTNGEAEVVENMKRVTINDKQPQPIPSPRLDAPPADSPARKEGTALGLLRRFSTRRNKDRDTDRPLPPPSFNIQPPQEPAPTPRKSFSVRRSRRREQSPPTLHTGGSQGQHEGLLSAGSSKGRSLLNRSTSVNSADFRPRRLLNRGASDATNSPRLAPEVPTPSGSEQSSLNGQKANNKIVEVEERPSAAPSSVAPRTPTTARTRSLGHSRHDSMQARRQRRDEARSRHENVPEETDAELQEQAAETPTIPDTPGADISRPAGLKGLFSSSTTSSKPAQFIRHDLIRVLKQLGVEYTEVRGGFSCRHAPSINLDDVREGGAFEDEKSGKVGTGHNRRISFGAFRNRDRDEFRDEKPHRQQSRRRQPDQSFVTNSEGSDEYVHASGQGQQQADMAATRTRVQDDNGERLVLRFEVAIVKIPLFNLHGIQFKKVQGGMNQYRSMTSTILNSLRL